MTPSSASRGLSPAHVPYPRWVKLWFWLSVVIALGVVARRIAALIAPSDTTRSPMAALEASLSTHAVLTTLHIVPATLFVLSAIAVFSRKAVPKALERFFFLAGWITGLTAYAMSFDAFGGWVERSAVLLFDTWFLVSLTRAFLSSRQNRPGRQKQWSIRAVGILLGIATTRPVVGFFFATAAFTHLVPRQFFGLAFWIGFLINTIAVELWLRTGPGRAKRPSSPTSSAASSPQRSPA